MTMNLENGGTRPFLLQEQSLDVLQTCAGVRDLGGGANVWGAEPGSEPAYSPYLSVKGARRCAARPCLPLPFWPSAPTSFPLVCRCRHQLNPPSLHSKTNTRVHTVLRSPRVSALGSVQRFHTGPLSQCGPGGLSRPPSLILCHV